MNLINILLPGLADTLYMLSITLLFTLAIGGPIGIILVLTMPEGLKPNKLLYSLLSCIVNLGRSVPFVILMIAVMPLSRYIVGTSIGTTASIVPLIVASVPFYSRVVETALKEVPAGIIEASLSMGASTKFIVLKVLIPEAASQIILGTTLTIIAQIGYSAMAGTIGGGGLGDIAIRFGYQRSQTDVLLFSVLILVILVFIIQTCGNILSNKLKK